MDTIERALPCCVTPLFTFKFLREDAQDKVGRVQQGRVSALVTRFRYTIGLRNRPQPATRLRQEDSKDDSRISRELQALFMKRADQAECATVWYAPCNDNSLPLSLLAHNFRIAPPFAAPAFGRPSLPNSRIMLIGCY